MASGIGWGTVHWRLPLRLRLAAVLVLLTVCSIPLLLVTDVWVMVPFVVLAGVAVSPSLISSFTLAELLVPRAAVTEAFTWIGTALGLGVAIGASVAGQDRRRRTGPTRPSWSPPSPRRWPPSWSRLFQRLLHVPAEHAATPALAR